MVLTILLKTEFLITFNYELSLVHWYKVAFLLRFTTDFESEKSINLEWVTISINYSRQDLQESHASQELGLPKLLQQHLRHVSTQRLESIEFSLRLLGQSLGMDPITVDKALAASL
jgi:hypothetical protein|tara:strand:- start:5 stop:352 length:348 start_codon:yes stop_codon:yes gene_type:complete